MTAVMEDNDHPGDFHRDVKYIPAFLYVRQLLWLNQRGHRFVAQIFVEKYLKALLKGFLRMYSSKSTQVTEQLPETAMEDKFKGEE